MEVLIPFLVVAVLVGGVWWSLHVAKERSAADNEAAVLATLAIPGGIVLRLTRDELIEGYGEGAARHPIAGLVARVEEGGSVNRRFTVTRIVALGVFAAGVPKKIDDRQLYLSIEGPTTIIVHAIPVAKSKTITSSAREFAAKVNQVSGSSASTAEEKQSTHAAPPTPVPASPDNEIADKIRHLARLRDDGLITSEEFEAKKAELLSRY